MKIANLGFVILPLVVRAVRKHFRQAINCLPLPRANLIRMNLVLRGDLLDRLVAPQSLQRYARLELSCKSPSRRHCISLRYTAEYTLTPCPIFQDQLNRTVENGQVIKIQKAKNGTVTREKLTNAWTDWIDYWSVDFDFERRKEIVGIKEADGSERQVWTGGYIFENEWQIIQDQERSHARIKKYAT